MDKKKFSRILQAMGAIGPFVEQEVLKEQEVLAYAQIPRGEGDDADQVCVMTRNKLVWVYAHARDGFMSYKTYFLRNLLAYEYGKIPAPAPDRVAKRAVLTMKFSGHGEVGIATTTENPENASDRHKTIVLGIDELERQLRQLTLHTRPAAENGNIYHEYAPDNWAN